VVVSKRNGFTYLIGVVTPLTSEMRDLDGTTVRHMKFRQLLLSILSSLLLDTLEPTCFSNSHRHHNDPVLAGYRAGKQSDRLCHRH